MRGETWWMCYSRPGWVVERPGLSEDLPLLSVFLGWYSPRTGWAHRLLPQTLFARERCLRQKVNSFSSRGGGDRHLDPKSKMACGANAVKV